MGAGPASPEGSASPKGEEGLSLAHGILIAVFRLAQGCLLRTYWTPDEFWQAHEVAHHMNFGCGHLTWEWQPEWMIRGPAHPMLFAALYGFLELFSLHTPTTVASAPRALQCLLAAVADCATHGLAAKIVGVGAARWVLFCQLSSWFNGYALLRPYSNSLEAVLAAVVFAQFASGARFRSWLSLAAAACVVRPTSAVLWICPWAYAVAKDSSPLLRLAETLLIAVVAVAVAVGIDTVYYGVPTWSAINFFRFNFLEGHSTLYGAHHAAWYLTEGLPAMLGTMAPLLLFADLRRAGKARVLVASVVVAVLAYSCSAHKELRFILPLLPLLLVFAGEGLWRLSLKRPYWQVAVLASFILVTNASAFAYLGLRHQRAPMACVERLREEFDAQPAGFSVDFLTTCHAAPFTSHLHAGLRCLDLRFLDCSPRRAADGGVTREGTDSARLLQEGATFVEEYYRRPGSRWPRFVVLAEELLANVSAVLPEYSQTHRFEHNIESSAALVLLRRIDG